MNNVDLVYQAIKAHNAKSPTTNGLQTSPVPAYTGDIKATTGLELDVIHTALEVLIERGLVVMNKEPLRSKHIDSYGKILNYPGLLAI